MATRKYSTNPQDKLQDVTAAAGSATTARVEVTVDWDTMAATDTLSGQQARLHVVNSLYRIAEYIEQTDKFNVKA